MKLTFTFTDTTDIQAIPADGIYQTYFEIPDEAKHLIGYEERIMAVARMVGQLTNVCLHITCKELDLKHYPIKTTDNPSGNSSVYHNINTFVFYFERFGFHRSQQRHLKILSPISPVMPQNFLFRRGTKARQKRSLRNNLIGLDWSWYKSDTESQHAALVRSLAEQILVLLNAEPTTNPNQQWACLGFHPRWVDSALIDLQNKRSKQREAEQRKQEREEAKRQARDEKLALKPSVEHTGILPQNGAGRRPRAVPGVFMGVQFRSQLEIRFVTELESRQIRWAYETARLGEGNYLVDFYLPDYKCWVEVKGVFEPRDNYLLKDVASYLLKERKERLLVYTQSKAFVVTSNDFEAFPRKQFWEKLLEFSKT